MLPARKQFYANSFTVTGTQTKWTKLQLIFADNHKRLRSGICVSYNIHSPIFIKQIIHLNY